jgi:hypothetical protein
VNVEAGGQAIVGNVDSGDRRKRATKSKSTRGLRRIACQVPCIEPQLSLALCHQARYGREQVAVADILIGIQLLHMPGVKRLTVGPFSSAESDELAQSQNQGLER